MPIAQACAEEDRGRPNGASVERSFFVTIATRQVERREDGVFRSMPQWNR
jgi:hypothetical protein